MHFFFQTHPFFEIKLQKLSLFFLISLRVKVVGLHRKKTRFSKSKVWALFLKICCGFFVFNYFQCAIAIRCLKQKVQLFLIGMLASSSFRCSNTIIHCFDGIFALLKVVVSKTCLRI